MFDCHIRQFPTRDHMTTNVSNSRSRPSTISKPHTAIKGSVISNELQFKQKKLTANLKMNLDIDIKCSHQTTIKSV